MYANSDILQRLHASVAAACPIDGVQVPTFGNSATVTIDFQASATVAQKALAQAVVNAFDWSQGAQAAWVAANSPKSRAVQWEGVVSQSLTTVASGANVVVGRWLATPAQGTPSGGHVGPLTPGTSAVLYAGGQHKITLSVSLYGNVTLQGATSLNVRLALDLYFA